MADQTTVPAMTTAILKIGGQELTVPEKASEFLIRRGKNGWEYQEVAQLGNNSVFVRRDGTGSLQLIHKNVALSIAKKEIVDMKGSYIITVPGYNKLNQIAGLHIITPPSIIVDGIEQTNPAVIYDPKTGEIKRVVARKIAVGYSPNGNMVAIDTVRHYNFDAYYLQDLHAKTGKPDAARYGTCIVCPFAPDAKVEEKGTMTYARKDAKVYVFKPIKDMEGIWIDPSHDEIKEVYKQHIQHQKFGDVTSQNMASRNAMKMHPAIAAAQVIMKNGEAVVPVFGFRHSITREQFEEIGKTIAAGEQPKDVQVVHDEGEAEYEEVQVGSETELEDGTASTETPQQAPAQSGQQEPPKTTGDIKSEIRALVTEKGIPNLDAFCKNMFETKFDNLTQEQYAKLKTVLTDMKKMGA
jgi:hypothetical protein